MMKQNEKLEFPTIEFTQVTLLGTGSSGQSCLQTLTEEEASHYEPDEIQAIEAQIVKK